MLCVKSTSLIRAQLRFICNSRILDISRELRTHLAILLHANVHCTCGHRLERFLGPQTLSFACNSIFSINRTFNLYNTEVCSTLAQVLRQQRERERERVYVGERSSRDLQESNKNLTMKSVESVASEMREREENARRGEVFPVLEKIHNFSQAAWRVDGSFFFSFAITKRCPYPKEIAIFTLDRKEFDRIIKREICHRFVAHCKFPGRASSRLIRGKLRVFLLADKVASVSRASQWKLFIFASHIFFFFTHTIALGWIFPTKKKKNQQQQRPRPDQCRLNTYFLSKFSFIDFPHAVKI